MEVNAQKIKNLRTENSWTQQHLADVCGISLRTVQRVERYGNTSNETLMSLASVFEIPQSEISIADEPLEVITSVIVLDKKAQLKLIVTSAFLGMSFGAFVMYALMILR